MRKPLLPIDAHGGLTRPVLLLARIATAGFFMIHAVSRIVYDTIPQFGQFMESQGFPLGEIWVWAITGTEIVAGTLVIAGRHVRPAASALMTIAVVGIIMIHRHFGWFVGEHGTGGMEYSVALIVLLLLVMADDYDRSRNLQTTIA